MKTLRIALLLTTLLLLAACSGRTPEATPPDASPNGGSEIALPAISAGGEEPTEQQPEAGGNPSGFDLPDAAVGLDALNSYHAVLQMDFAGSQKGQAYNRQKTFNLIVDRNQDALVLLQTSTDETSTPSELLTAQIGPVRYEQAGPDADCQVGLAAESSAPLFEPAHALPHLTGATEAGQETVNGVPAVVYQFDQRTLGLDGEGTAAGKVWIAQDGGWVVKYELSLSSDVVFGEGMSGEQRWSYEVSEVGQAQALLPGSCPQPLADFPVPDDATEVVRSPGQVRFNTGLAEADLGAFYAEQLPALGWSPMDAPPESSGQIRWAYTLAGEQSQQIALIRARPGEGSLQVTIFQVEMEITAE